MVCTSKYILFNAKYFYFVYIRLQIWIYYQYIIGIRINTLPPKNSIDDNSFTSTNKEPYYSYLLGGLKTINPYYVFPQNTFP